MDLEVTWHVHRPENTSGILTPHPASPRSVFSSILKYTWRRIAAPTRCWAYRAMADRAPTRLPASTAGITLPNQRHVNDAQRLYAGRERLLVAKMQNTPREMTFTATFHPVPQAFFHALDIVLTDSAMLFKLVFLSLQFPEDASVMIHELIS
jgi:hypothetical protein